MRDQFHRISAAALRRRGLVTTSWRGSTWTAKVTAAGTDYLRDLDGKNPPVPRQANVSVTQQLVDDVIAAGGSLRVPRKTWYSRDAVDYENRARLAERYRKVPAGKRLHVIVAGGELEISLVDAPHRGAPSELVPVPVPERTGRYHMALRARACEVPGAALRRVRERVTETPTGKLEKYRLRESPFTAQTWDRNTGAAATSTSAADVR